MVLGSSVVLYAQGWRMGFQPFALGRIGAVYVRTFPANAQITLNNKMKERNLGLFEKGTLLNDLLPGEYELEAKAPGFQPLTLPVAVSSSMVTSLKNVVLVPDSPIVTTSTAVQNIFLAGTTLLTETASGTQTLSGLPIKGEILAGSEDGTVVLSYVTSTRNYFAAEVSRATSTNLGRLPGQPAGNSVISFQPVPKDDTLFLAKGPASLSLLRVPSGEILQIATTGVIAAAAAPGKVVWATFDTKTNASLLSAYDIPSQNRDMNFEFVPGKITSFVFRDSGDIFALANDGSLYLLNLNQSSRVRLAQNVRGMTSSKDGVRMAILDGQGVKIFLQREELPELDIQLPEAARIQRLVWYRDGEHLFVQYPDKILFLDLNDTELRNFTTVATTARAEYEPNGNILYFLKDSMLYELDFPSS
jgi:hypothetical protein